jgi:hypothetical protein
MGEIETDKNFGDRPREYCIFMDDLFIFPFDVYKFIGKLDNFPLMCVPDKV